MNKWMDEDVRFVAARRAARFTVADDRMWHVRLVRVGDRVGCCAVHVTALLGDAITAVEIAHTADCPHSGARTETVAGDQVVVTLQDGWLGVANLSGLFPHEKEGGRYV